MFEECLEGSNSLFVIITSRYFIFAYNISYNVILYNPKCPLIADQAEDFL
jgi:hypothetical protein